MDALQPGLEESKGLASSGTTVQEVSKEGDIENVDDDIVTTQARDPP